MTKQRIAIVGVGGVGGHILKHTLATGLYDVVVLSRSVRPNPLNAMTNFPRALPKPP